MPDIISHRLDNPQNIPVEFLTAAELAARLKVKVSWVVDQTKPSRTRDPIPTIHLGRHNRYLWGSKALTAWLERRMNGNGRRR